MSEKNRRRGRNGVTAFGVALAGLALGVGFLSGCFGGNRTEHGNVAIDVSPDGQRVVFSAADGDLYLFDLTTHAVQPLTRTKEIESTPVFAPDGQWISYSGEGNTGRGGRSVLCLRSLDGKIVRRLTRTREVADYEPSFSPDGKRILFAGVSQSSLQHGRLDV